MAFGSITNSRLQLATTPQMRGRVMALWVIAVVGTRVIGGPLVGWFGQDLGPRSALGIGALTLTVVLPFWLLRGRGDESASVIPTVVFVENE